MSKFAKGNNTKKNFKGQYLKKKKNNFHLKFHQVIYSLFPIRCISLKLLALKAFKISRFLCQNLQRAITKKK